MMSIHSPADESGATGSTAGGPLWPDAPYRGLRPYTEQDAPLFFGRRSEADLVIANMMASRLTLLYGPSGVGKTSLLRAGVYHHLLELARKNVAGYGSPEFVAVYFNDWQDDPLQGLLNAIREAATPFATGEIDAPSEATDLSGAVAGWTKALDSDLLIILDQVEEYLLYHRNEEGDDSFAVQFPRVVNRGDPRVSFLVSIREDALAGLDRFKGSLPSIFVNFLRLRHLGSGAGREAIEGPLQAYSQVVSPETPFTAEPELVAAVLAQVQIGQVAIEASGRGECEWVPEGGGPGRLVETPYLQLVLARLWQEELAAGSYVLRAETLRRLGGAQQIVRTHLDEALAALPPRQQDVAAEVFHFLVTASGTKIAQTAHDLAYYAELPEAEVTATLERLARGDVRVLRPVTTSSRRSEAAPAYEIFHDVLAPAVLGWRTKHLGTRTAEIRLGEKIERTEEEAKEAKERAARYRAQLRRLGVVAMALLLALLSIALAGFAWQRQRIAEEQRNISRSSALAAAAINYLNGDAGRSLPSALDALTVARIPEAEGALRRGLSGARVRAVFPGHGGTVTSVAVSPDGSFLLSAGIDKTLRVWSLTTGNQVALRRMDRPAQYYGQRPRFSSDGQLVLAVSRNEREALLWRWRTSERPIVISPGVGLVAAALSRNAEHVVTGQSNGTTRVWSRTGQALETLQQKGRGAVSVAVSPDGQWVAVGGSKGAVSLWRWQSSSEPLVLAGHEAKVTTVVFSGDGRRLVSASDDGTARVFSVPDGAEVADLRGHTDWVRSAAFSRDGRLVVTASSDKTARVFSASEGRLVAVLRGHGDEVLNAEFSPNGRLVVTASVDGTSRVWYVGTGVTADAGVTLLELRGHAGPVYSAAFTPDGSSVVTASADATARRWDVQTGQVFWGHDEPLRSAVFDFTGKHVLTSAGRVFDTATGRLIAKLPVLPPAGGKIVRAAFSPDGRSVAVSRTDNSAVVLTWNAPGEYAQPPAQRQELRLEAGRDEEGVISVAFSRDGRWLATTTTQKSWVWDTRTGEIRHRVSLPQEEMANPFAKFLGAVFSLDGRRLLIPQFDKKARLWDVETGKPVLSLEGLTGVVYSAGFSKDGAQIVTASADGTARVWSSEDGRQLHVLTSPAGQLRSAAFSPDGQWVAGGTVDGSTVVWNVSSERVAAVLHQHADLVGSVEFSRDGELILTASDDQTAKAYPCQYCRPLEELITLARQRVDATSP